jgi:hypothetical protein
MKRKTIYIVKEALICRIWILEAFVSLATVILENVVSTELLGLFWTLSIVLYVEDKNTTTFRRLDLSPSSGGWGRINVLSWAR